MLINEQDGLYLLLIYTPSSFWLLEAGLVDLFFISCTVVWELVVACSALLLSSATLVLDSKRRGRVMLDAKFRVFGNLALQGYDNMR